MDRSLLLQLIRRIPPHDALERQHRDSVLEWVESGAGLYRTEKPATPPKHLVAYFLPVDPGQGSGDAAALLVDHRAASLWLPPGGHLEPGEDPAEAVRRELREELGWEAQFLFDRVEPLFLTVNRVPDPTGGHTDASLWYALRADRDRTLTLDATEHRQARWFHLNELPYGQSDPHLNRFIEKLSGYGFSNATP